MAFEPIVILDAWDDPMEISIDPGTNIVHLQMFEDSNGEMVYNPEQLTALIKALKKARKFARDFNTLKETD